MSASAAPGSLVFVRSTVELFNRPVLNESDFGTSRVAGLTEMGDVVLVIQRIEQDNWHRPWFYVIGRTCMGWLLGSEVSDVVTD